LLRIKLEETGRIYNEKEWEPILKRKHKRKYILYLLYLFNVYKLHLLFIQE